MKVSVVTVVRNDAEHIRETIRSVLEQQGIEPEYIVIDGGSTDGTAEIVREYAAQLAYFCSEPDGGIYPAMNKGIARASGDVVGIINSGDRYLPGALKIAADAFAGKDLSNSIFWGDVQYEKIGRVRGFRPENRYRGAFAPHPSMFVPLGVYRKYGAYDESFRLLGDYEFMYRQFNVNHLNVIYVPELIAFYREGGLSDRHITGCLHDELRVKLRYQKDKIRPRIEFILKLIKNIPRILFA